MRRSRGLLKLSSVAAFLVVCLVGWVRLADPCGGTGTHVRDTIDLAATAGGFLADLCSPRNPQQASAYSITTSTDDGHTWGSRHAVPAAAQFYPELIVAASPNDLLVTNSAGSGNGPYTYRLMLSTDADAHWSTLVSDREQVTPNAPNSAYLAFQSSLVGRWVGHPHAIWTTTDGGHHWTRRPFP